MKPVFLALTATGLATAQRARAVAGGEVHALKKVVEAGAGPANLAFEDVGAHCRSLFSTGRPIVGVCAAGILIRFLAPLLADKRAEPPVIALSEDGRAVVPLLGGHHGANALARLIAGHLSGFAAVTTAGDTRFGIALDEPPEGYVLANPEDAKGAMSACLAGARLELEGRLPWIETSELPRGADAAIRLVATSEDRKGDGQTLVYHPKSLAVGVGCERDAAPEEVLRLVEETLGEAGLSPLAVAALVSIDLKADEAAILAAAEKLGVPARFFDAARLEEETPRLENPSETVFREVGAHGVAEAAALAAAGAEGMLVVAKKKSARATCAIAEALDPIDASAIGRGRGRLAIVGIGPGTAAWRTPEAAQLIDDSDSIIGYKYYLDLIDSLIGARERIDSTLGAERERCAAALKLAGEGRKVALVCSGDPGIYAMASLVMELLEAEPDNSPARRAEMVVAPGISAFQAASARIGAPFGHDFCLISLSDLLTPWETILQRVGAAAEGDFVVAFYNPVSQKRRHQLADARDILLTCRPGETPVLIARLLGREDEHLKLTTLAELSIDEVDMMSLVVVGSSQSRTFRAGGRDFLFTPRGYDRKQTPEKAREDAL
ncbi:precorrin-3B C(17)-methyltransferase [Afifella sp. IM 167]|uniref:precorrin-3B C(17)-methyltransferase n=1 Tax=Afifella sp. IM 167 TaxID=2033586 RepID=UPI001CCC7A51|nr:precorrin-3B C(17)-methyltransferase [Afifella sp. IM 167]MBZ8134975.1 precorrin-3B C(17)-methyltransferase [Afifella sp. IM 167]